MSDTVYTAIPISDGDSRPSPAPAQRSSSPVKTFVKLLVVVATIALLPAAFHSCSNHSVKAVERDFPAVSSSSQDGRPLFNKYKAENEDLVDELFEVKKEKGALRLPSRSSSSSSSDDSKSMKHHGHHHHEHHHHPGHHNDRSRSHSHKKHSHKVPDSRKSKKSHKKPHRSSKRHHHSPKSHKHSHSWKSKSKSKKSHSWKSKSKSKKSRKSHSRKSPKEPVVEEVLEEQEVEVPVAILSEEEMAKTEEVLVKVPSPMEFEDEEGNLIVGEPMEAFAPPMEEQEDTEIDSPIDVGAANAKDEMVDMMVDVIEDEDEDEEEMESELPDLAGKEDITREEEENDDDYAYDDDEYM